MRKFDKEFDDDPSLQFEYLMNEHIKKSKSYTENEIVIFGEHENFFRKWDGVDEKEAQERQKGGRGALEGRQGRVK